jgi:CheY-like chemotaxis protein
MSATGLRMMFAREIDTKGSWTSVWRLRYPSVRIRSEGGKWPENSATSSTTGSSWWENRVPRAPLVSVVDDDESVRESLPDLLRTFGFASRAFSSAAEFLASEFVDQTDCLVVDVAMPGMSGPALQQELSRRGSTIPIVFITAHGDESMRPRMLQAGAIECLLKPFSETALLDAVTLALQAR